MPCIRSGFNVSFWTAGKATRDRLVDQGVLQISPDSPEHYLFTEDCAFTSPSLAAASVLGRNSNGRLEWKIKGTGKSYGDWQEDQA